MAAARVIAAALFAVIAAAWRRLFRGPRLPSWSFQTEMAVAGQRAGLTKLSVLEPRKARRLMEAALPDPPEHDDVTERRGELGGVPVVRHETPGSRHAGPHLLYFHGGGYVLGSPSTHAALTVALARGIGGCVVSVDYRLAPEHPFPAAREDALAAYRALLEQGASPSQVVVGGDSAGGNLAASLLIALRESEERLPAGGVLICPWVDLSNGGSSFDTNALTDTLTRPAADVWSAQYRGGRDARDPAISPLYADLSGLPPLLVQAGGAEVLVDQIGSFATRAREAGVDVEHDVVPEMFHDWMLVDFVPQAAPTIERICAYVRKRVGQ